MWVRIALVKPPAGGIFWAVLSCALVLVHCDDRWFLLGGKILTVPMAFHFFRLPIRDVLGMWGALKWRKAT